MDKIVHLFYKYLEIRATVQPQIFCQSTFYNNSAIRYEIP